MYYFLVLLTFSLYSTNEVNAKAFCPNMRKMENCVKDAEHNWGIERDNQNQDYKSWCCFQWDVYYCQMDLGKNCVGDFDSKKFNVSMAAVYKDIEDDCNQHPHDSCRGQSGRLSGGL